MMVLSGISGNIMTEAYIETQTGNCIKVCHSDCGGEFLSKDMIDHQDCRGTIQELTVHNSLQQNSTEEQSMRTHAEQA